MLLLNTTLRSSLPCLAFFLFILFHLFSSLIENSVFISVVSCSEERVFVHKVVVVGDLPVPGRLVAGGQHIEKLGHAHVGFEAHDIFGQLVVVITQQDLRVVLVLHEELHWRLNEGSHSHAVRFVSSIDVVAPVTLVIDRRIVSARGTEEGRLRGVPVLSGAIFSALEADSVGDLHLEDLDAGLLNGQICHFNIQTVEVDAIKTLIDGLGELALADVLHTGGVVPSARLMELSEKGVEFEEGA